MAWSYRKPGAGRKKSYYIDLEGPKGYRSRDYGDTAVGTARQAGSEDGHRGMIKISCGEAIDRKGIWPSGVEDLCFQNGFSLLRPPGDPNRVRQGAWLDADETEAKRRRVPHRTLSSLQRCAPRHLGTTTSMDTTRMEQNRRISVWVGIHWYLIWHRRA